MDQPSFEELVRRHQASVCAIAYSRLQDRARSEEVAQEAFLVAWLRRNDKPPTAAWVCGIARNLARNAARRPKEQAMTSEIPSPAPNARDQLIDREDQTRAIAELAKLPERFRDAIVLFYRGDESITEVAGALGISVAAARKRVVRGRDKLHDALAGVERTLRASGPSTAFTTAVVAAWSLRSRDTAAATAINPDAAAIATRIGRWKVLTAAVGFAGALVAGSVVLVATGAVGSSHPEPGTPTTTVAHFDRTASRGSPPSLPGHQTVMVTPRPHHHATRDASIKPVDLDSFPPMPFSGLASLLAGHLDMTPVRVDQSLATIRVKVRGNGLDPLDTLDDIVAELHAVRTDVAMVKVHDESDRLETNAATLGGDPITLQVTNANVHDVLHSIEDGLHMQITLYQSVEGDAPGALEHYRTAAPPTVTLDLHDVPAGVALQALLEQMHYSYEVVTGFVIAPADVASSEAAR